MENTTEKKSKELQEEQERCFVIMPISDQGDYPKGHFTKVYNQIFKPAIIAAGYEPFRVDEDKISNPIINKIFDAVQNCTMALCDLSNRNPNVLYELGLRQAYDKPVVLVQDEKTPRIFDVSGINTVQYSSERLFENVMEAREKITDALIRNTTDRKSYLKNYETTVSTIHPENFTFNFEEPTNLDKSKNIWKREKFLVELKKSITREEVNDALNRIINKGINIGYNLNGNELVVEVVDSYLKINKVMVKEILENLGEVKTL